MGTKTKAKHTGPLTVRYSGLNGVVMVFDTCGPTPEIPIARFARAGESGENLANAILFANSADLLAAAEAGCVWCKRILIDGDGNERTIEPGNA